MLPQNKSTIVGQASRLSVHRRDAGATGIAGAAGFAGATGRRAFTMIELLVAATITALVATSGATFISAIANASETTRYVRQSKTEGHFAIFQLSKVIREARGIGEVTPNSVTLWLADTTKDDKINLYETGLIRYDVANQQIVFDSLTPPGGTIPATQVLTSAFTDFPTLSALSAAMPVADKKSSVWATNVSSATFAGQGSTVQTRYVDIQFTLNINGQTVPFRTAAGPKGQADYLFYSETRLPPPVSSTRKGRKVASGWDGFTTAVPGIGAALSAL